MAAPPANLPRALLAAMIAASLILAGCAGLWPFSGPRPRPATVPPPVTAPAPAPAYPVPEVRIAPAPSYPVPEVRTAPAPSYPVPEVRAAPPSSLPEVGTASAPPLAPEVQAEPPSPTSSTPAEARTTSDTIALVLPLQSPPYGAAAAAVEAGFVAAAGLAGDASRIRVIGHGDDGVLPAFAAATEGGAAVAVGPLTRDDVKTVLTLALARPRMLALNQPEDGSRLPNEVYALSLSVDSDAELLARRAYADGMRALATVTSDAPLQRRFRAAFAAEWERTGGTITRNYRFDSNPEVLSVLRRELAARTPDAILLAVDGANAALARSFLPPGPVYASSQIADDLTGPMLRDLEGVRYVEIPWLAEPSSLTFASLPHTDLADPVLERLYALGLDAYTIASLLASPVPPDRVEFEGATGHISLAPGGVFVREGRIMLIRGGQAVPYPNP